VLIHAKIISIFIVIAAYFHTALKFPNIKADESYLLFLSKACKYGIIIILSTDMMRNIMEILIHEKIVSLFQKRDPDTHKGNYGRVLLIGGDARYGGAIILASGAALHAGAGLISAATDPCNHCALHSRYPEVMVADWHHVRTMDPLIKQADVLVIGPGLGDQIELLESVFSKIFPHQKLVLDADALNLIAKHSLSIPRSHAFLTPHPGEWKRLSGLGSDDVENLAWAQEKGVNILLKGHRSRLYTSEGIFVNPTGNPCMATGGSGDVLSGILGALLAYFPSPLNAFKAAVYLHGYVADELAKAQCPVLPSRLIEALPLFIHQFQNKSGL